MMPRQGGMMRLRISIWLLFSCVTISVSDAEAIVIADFEGDSYGEWEVQGDAFGDRPARGTLIGQHRSVDIEVLG